MVRELLSEFDFVEPPGLSRQARSPAPRSWTRSRRVVSLCRRGRGGWRRARPRQSCWSCLRWLPTVGVAPSRPRPSPTPHTKARGLIVYGVRRDIRAVAGSAVYSIHPNGTGRVLLYGRGLDARLSPDGTTIMDAIDSKPGEPYLIRYRLGSTRVHKMNGNHNPGPDLQVGVWNPEGPHMVCITKFGMFEYDTATATTWLAVALATMGIRSATRRTGRSCSSPPSASRVKSTTCSSWPRAATRSRPTRPR